ncbi:hypothetical protein AB0K89_07460 [Streptomyces cinnamoneus]|uniref:hypothetical protein n=1 Tax=Streptomyces cinnamoneus TaxID=53446 RepID=UPI0034407B96
MRTVSHLTVACVMGLGLAPAATAAPGTVTGPDARTVVLTTEDDDRILTVRSGDVLDVRLAGHHDRGRTFSWHVPSASDSMVLGKASGGTSPEGGAGRRFSANARGTATIGSQRTCLADAGYRCPEVTLSWKVVVTVR